MKLSLLDSGCKYDSLEMLRKKCSMGKTEDCATAFKTSKSIILKKTKITTFFLNN